MVKSEMTNTKIKSKLVINKVDTNNNPLAGVVIGIYDLNDNLLGEYTTDENGIIEVELEYGSYYYKEIKKYDESTAVFDRAFFGITVTGWVNLDLDIVSQKTYKIRGILSYNSDSLETSFFLRGLKHVWDTDGCKTELDFIR